jgi:ADP-dependent NAD(P)H-hydrate dehydratase / NAD(P)H-hydrate epimerase
MATAGAGDVLSGIVGAMLAQGLSAAMASVVSAYLHGAAGDKAAESLGEDGLIAGDIVAALPHVLSEMRSGQYVGTYIEEEALSLQV